MPNRRLTRQAPFDGTVYVTHIGRGHRVARATGPKRPWTLRIALVRRVLLGARE
jgi:hypothetical protein